MHFAPYDNEDESWCPLNIDDFYIMMKDVNFKSKTGSFFDLVEKAVQSSSEDEAEIEKNTPKKKTKILSGSKETPSLQHYN